LSNVAINGLGKGSQLTVQLLLTLTIGLALLVGLIEAWWLQGPLERDQSIYFIIAQELLNGRLLYADLWDHKPPAIHVAYACAQLLLGRSMFAVWGLSVFLSLLTGCGIGLILVQLAVRRSALIVALLFWAVLSVSPNLEASQPITEAFINLFLVWSFAALIIFRSVKLGYLYAAACFALATLFKPVAFIFLLPFAFHILLSDSLSRAKKCRALFAFIFVPLLLWTAVSVYFGLTGRWSHFYGAVFLYNRYYAGDVVENLLGIFSIKRIYRLGIGALWVPILISLFSFRSPSLRSEYIVAASWCFAIVVAIALPGNFYLHYYQLALPWVLIAFALGLTSVSKRWERSLVICAFCGLVIFEFSLFLFPSKLPRNPFYPHSPFVQARALAPYLKEILPADGWFYEWGAQAELYAATGVSPKHGTLYIDWLLRGPVAQELTDKTLAVLVAQPPEFVVISRSFVNAKGRDNLVWRWLEAHYKDVRQFAVAPDLLVARRVQ
jgi:hypothetical protein